MTQRGAQRRNIGLHGLIRAVLLGEVRDLGEERHHCAAAVARQFASNQIERLNAVRALVDHGDARIAHELLHAVLADIAVAAEHLLRRDRVGKAGVGEHAFDHRRHQAHVIFGGLAGFLILRAVLDVAPQRRPQDQRARRLVERLDRHQGAADIRMHDDRIGGLVGRLHARDRAALQALARIVRGVLVGDFGLREALHADREPRLIHHGEHGMQALVGFTHQPAGRAVKIHHACGVAVNAHLVFDRAAHHTVARAD